MNNLDFVLFVSSIPARLRQAKQETMERFQGLTCSTNGERLFFKEEPHCESFLFLLADQQNPERFAGYCGTIGIHILDPYIPENIKEVLRGALPENEWSFDY